MIKKTKHSSFPLQCLLLIFISFFSHSLLFAQTDREFYTKGNDCFAKSDFKCSVSEYTKAIEKNNRNEDYFYKRGISYCRLEKKQFAYNDFSQGLKINSFSSKLYLERGKVLFASKLFDEAGADFTMAINYSKVDSIKLKALEYRASIRHQKLDYEGSYEDNFKAYQMDTNNVYVMNNLSIVLDRLNKTEEAKALLFKIMAKDSTFSGAYLNMAFQLSRAEKYTEAVPYFEKCLKLDPKNAINYSNRSFNRLKLHDTEGALKDINYSIKLDPSNSWAYKNRGLIFLEQGKIEKACDEFNKAIELGYTKQYGNEVKELLAKNCEVKRK